MIWLHADERKIHLCTFWCTATHFTNNTRYGSIIIYTITPSLHSGHTLWMQQYITNEFSQRLLITSSFVYQSPPNEKRSSCVGNFLHPLISPARLSGRGALYIVFRF